MNDKGIVQLKLRMREPLRAAVADYAKETGISMNAAMVDRLERSFRDDAVLEALARIEAKVAPARRPPDFVEGKDLGNGWYLRP